MRTAKEIRAEANEILRDLSLLTRSVTKPYEDVAMEEAMDDPRRDHDYGEWEGY